MAETRNLGSTISAWTRERTEAHLSPHEIDSRNLDAIESSLPSYSVSQKQLLLLRALSLRSRFPGETLKVWASHDYPIAWSSNETEFLFYLDMLTQRGYLRDLSPEVRVMSQPDKLIQITGRGWEFIDEQARAGVLSDQAFVAMSFSESLRLVWEDAIKPAIAESGYRPYRVDTDPHIDRIDVKIIAEIRNSRFLISDVTEHRPGVYFEAGYALGLGLPVIWTVREDDLPNAHFDTRQYNHIVWKTPAELRERLFFTICAVIGKRK